jgi:glycosyltransferase involved in cell wall biosynthesis
MKTLRVAAFTGGKNISGARFRIRQYIPALNRHSIEVDEFYPRLTAWPPDNKLQRPFWLVGTLLERLPSVMRSHRYDLTLLQRELISTLSSLEIFTKRPRVFDVDDAVWLNRGGRTGFKTIVQRCDGVICGNSFIAETAIRWNPSICLLPTAVDTDRFVPSAIPLRDDGKRIIGWSGLAVSLKYVYEIEEALLPILTKDRNVVLRIVSEKAPRFKSLPVAQVEYVPWSPQNEVQTIQEMTVGIMPIEDSLWSRGKCSYKMLLYMSCGIPVIVSPVGMNAEVLAQGRVGFGPKSIREWTEALDALLESPEEAQTMGVAGRQVVEEHYALHVLAPKLISFLRTIAG